MKIEVEEDYTIVLKEVFNPIKLVSAKGKIIQIKLEPSVFYPNLECDEIRIIPFQPNHGVMEELHLTIDRYYS